MHKLKLIEIHSATNTLNTLLAFKSTNFQRTRSFAKAIQALEMDSKLIEAKRLELIEKYGIGGNILDDASADALNKDFSEFLEQEVEIDFTPISESLLEGIELSPNDYLVLKPFLVE